MEFSRPEYWSGQPFPSPGDLPTQRSNPGLWHCRQILYQLSYIKQILHASQHHSIFSEIKYYKFQVPFHSLNLIQAS